MGDQTRHEFIEALKRIVTGAVKQSKNAHNGEVEPTSVAKRVAGQMWARTLPEGHPNSAEWVRYVRGSLGLSQRELAAVIGVHQVTVARWETGEQAPRGARLQRLKDLGQNVPPVESTWPPV